MKEAWAAIILQKYCRGYLVRNLYQLIRVAAITIQAHTRGFLARRRYRKVCSGLRLLFFTISSSMQGFW